MPIFSDQPRLNKVLVVLVALAAAVFCGLYLYHWELGYDADIGMIGLIARRIVHYGEHPIFVWKVGYQGMLLEGHAVALIFKLFGSSIYTLSIAPCLFFLACAYFFYRSTRQHFGQTAGLLATVFLFASCPSLYDRVLRTQPNYAETFLFGMILFSTYYRLVELLYVRRAKPGREVFWLGGIFGFVAGFGIYTYGQIFYFLLAIAAHLFLIFLRSESNRSLLTIVLRLVFPQLRLKPGWKKNLLGSVALFNLLHLGFGLMTFGLGIQSVTVGGNTVRWDSVAMLQASLELLILLNLVVLAGVNRKKIRPYAAASAATAGLFLLGYSPTLIYRFILKGTVSPHTGVGGSLTQIAQRFGWALYGQARILNLLPLNPLSAVSGAFALFCVGLFLKNLYEKAWDFSRGKGATGSILQIPPLIFLLPVVFLLFSFSSVAWHWTQYRYTVVLALFYAVALSYSSIYLFQNLTSKRWKPAVPVFLVLVLANNSLGFYRAVRELDQPYPQLPIMEWMKNRGIHHAYADYYYGYSMSFLSNEEIIIEPVYSNYNPYYGAIVDQADYIAYVDEKPYKIPIGEKEIGLSGSRFRILEVAHFGKADAFRLQRIRPGTR